MSIYIVIGTVFASVFLLVLASGLLIVTKKSPRSTVISRLSYYHITQKEEQVMPSFFNRVIISIIRKIAPVAEKFSPKGVVESTRHELELAGVLERIGINVFWAVKFLFPVGFLFIFILLLIFFNLSLIVFMILLALILVSYFFPDVYLRNKIKNRQEEIRRSLPNALDMLTITIEAGMGFDIALSRIASNIKGPLCEVFNKMLKEMDVGLSRREAFQNLAKRTNVPDLDSFIAAVNQAEILGISISKSLRVQASEMRTRRRLRAEEAGIKAPVKLVFPLIFCLFPALMVVIVGPGLIMIYENLLGIIK
jgi:tight adherence protein C